MMLRYRSFLERLERPTSWCIITLSGRIRLRCLASVVLPEHVAPLNVAKLSKGKGKHGINTPNTHEYHLNLLLRSNGHCNGTTIRKQGVRNGVTWDRKQENKRGPLQTTIKRSSRTNSTLNTDRKCSVAQPRSLITVFLSPPGRKKN